MGHVFRCFCLCPPRKTGVIEHTTQRNPMQESTVIVLDSQRESALSDITTEPSFSRDRIHGVDPKTNDDTNSHVEL